MPVEPMGAEQATRTAPASEPEGTSGLSLTLQASWLPTTGQPAVVRQGGAHRRPPVPMRMHRPLVHSSFAEQLTPSTLVAPERLQAGEKWPYRAVNAHEPWVQSASAQQASVHVPVVSQTPERQSWSREHALPPGTLPTAPTLTTADGTQ